MEIETELDYKEDEIKDGLNAIMPDGIEITACGRLAETSKTAVAAVLDFASYKILFSGDADDAQKLRVSCKAVYEAGKYNNCKIFKEKKEKHRK